MASAVGTTAVPPSPPETFAMLPDSVAATPSSRDDATAQTSIAPPPVTVGYVSSGSMQVPAVSNNAAVDKLISTYAANYEVPESLVRRVVKRESNFRPGARNGPYYGLMQILPATARGLGFDGPPSALLDAETNLKYAVKYLKGAFMVAGGDHDQAVRNYSRGYYFEAKRKGMLGVMDGMLVKKRTRMPAETMVASAGALAATPPAAPIDNIASQWETGFATATGSKSAALPATSSAMAVRMSGGSVQTVSDTSDTGIGFNAIGATSTPSLGGMSPAGE